MVDVLKYVVFRFVLFVGALALVTALGAGFVLGLLLAAGISTALSYVMLRGQREKVTAAVAHRVDARLAAQDQARMQAAKEREETPGGHLDLGTPAHGITLGNGK